MCTKTYVRLKKSKMSTNLEELPGSQRPPKHLPVCAVLQRRLEAVQRRARDAPCDALAPCGILIIFCVCCKCLSRLLPCQMSFEE